MKDFKNPKVIGLLVAGLIGIWHLTVFMTSKTTVAAPFMAKPVEGYTWMGMDNAEPRFFLQNTDVKWQAGTPHPEYKAETTENVGAWQPMAGYEFVDKTKSLQTVWQPNTQHPDYMAWADKAEGQWSPVTGYKFIYNGDTFTDAVWDSNHRYNDLKVIALSEKDKYAPFPGYRFTKPNESLEVMWVPGTVNYERPSLVAAQQADNWIANSKPVSPRRYRPESKGLTPAQAFIIGAGIGGVVGHGIGRRGY